MEKQAPKETVNLLHKHRWQNKNKELYQGPWSLDISYEHYIQNQIQKVKSISTWIYCTFHSRIQIYVNSLEMTCYSISSLLLSAMVFVQTLLDARIGSCTKIIYRRTVNQAPKLLGKTQQTKDLQF